MENTIAMPERPRNSAGDNTGLSPLEQVIVSELYPEDRFPVKYFPDLKVILLDLFGRLQRNNSHLQEIYSRDRNHPIILQAARETLTFKNLLHHHPKVVVLIYREYISRFIAFKHRNGADRDDILQEILTRLMEVKIFKIQKQFDFDFKPYNEEENSEELKKISTFSSYLMVTVRNIYIDILRERNVRPLTSGEVQELEETADHGAECGMVSKVLLDEEMAKLKMILVMYHKSRPRLELCLKLKCRIVPTPEDVLRCFPRCSAAEVERLSADFSMINDKKLFEMVVDIFNRHDGRENKSDTLRKWVNVKTDEVISHLNKTHGSKVYNTDNIADFVGFYYSGSPQGRRRNLQISTG